MSFWKSLFGGGTPSDAAKPLTTAEHDGFTITAEPFAAEGQYQVAGTITKEIGGVVKSYRFVRADKCASADDAAEIALRKGRQIVAEQGERMFP
jgi:hypothetical protein